VDGKLLIVDDDGVLLDNLEYQIHQFYPNFEVTKARSVPEALEAIAKIQFDVVLTDMRMPRDKGDPRPEGDEGLAVVRAARERDALTEIIVLTAHGSLSNVREALEEGASQYVDKHEDEDGELTTRIVGTRMTQVLLMRRGEGDRATLRVCARLGELASQHKQQIEEAVSTFDLILQEIRKYHPQHPH
jgi:CheY-like chemotaxis protein